MHEPNMGAPRSRHALAFIFVTVLLDAIGSASFFRSPPALIVDLIGGDLSGASLYGGWLGFVFAANAVPVRAGARKPERRGSGAAA